MFHTHTGGVRADCPTSILPPLDLPNRFHVRAVHIHSTAAAVSHVTFLHAITFIMYYVFQISQNVIWIHYVSTTYGSDMLVLSVFCTIDLGVCGCVELYLPQVTTPSVPIISSAWGNNNCQIFFFFPHYPLEHPAVFVIKLNLGNQSSSSFNLKWGEECQQEHKHVLKIIKYN